MSPTTRSTKEQNSTLDCAKIKGKSKRKREKIMTSDSTITITIKDFKLWFSRSMHQCKLCQSFSKVCPFYQGDLLLGPQELRSVAVWSSLVLVLLDEFCLFCSNSLIHVKDNNFIEHQIWLCEGLGRRRNLEVSLYTIDYGTDTVNRNLSLKNITKGVLHSKRSMDNGPIRICMCMQDSIFCIYCLSRSLISITLQILHDIGNFFCRVWYDAPNFHVLAKHLCLLIFYEFNFCSSRSATLICIEESHLYFSLPLVAVNTSTTTKLRFLGTQFKFCENTCDWKVCKNIYIMVFRQQFLLFKHHF